MAKIEYGVKPDIFKITQLRCSHQVPVIQTAQKQRRMLVAQKVQKTVTIPQVQYSVRDRGYPVPQVEEEQTVDVTTHSSKLEADVQ